MTRLEALQALAEKVEAGKWWGDMGIVASYCSRAGFSVRQSVFLSDAYHGSLDAAKALHDAVLPGWGWEVYHEGYVRIWPRPLGDAVYSEGASEIHSRAWFLTILKALIAIEQAKGDE